MIVLIKLILWIMLFSTLFICFIIYRNIKLERNVLNVQKQYGSVNLRRKKFKLHYLNIILIAILAVGLYQNATTIYLSTTGFNVNVDCAIDINNDQSVVEVSDDIFIAKINELEDIKEFNILNKDHTLMLDKYFYNFTPIYNLKGTSNLSNKLLKSRKVNHDQIQVEDLCVEDKDIIVGKVYLLLGVYVDEESAKKQTDPRNNNTDYYHNFKAVLLDGYDTTKSLDEQDESIRSIVDYYKNYIS